MIASGLITLVDDLFSVEQNIVLYRVHQPQLEEGEGRQGDHLGGRHLRVDSEQ